MTDGVKLSLLLARSVAPLYAFATDRCMARMYVILLKPDSRATCDQAAALRTWDNHDVDHHRLFLRTPVKIAGK